MPFRISRIDRYSKPLSGPANSYKLVASMWWCEGRICHQAVHPSECCNNHVPLPPLLLLLAGVAAGALEIQLPNRVAYVYSIRQPTGVTGKEAYNTYLRHMMVDGKPITVQVTYAYGASGCVCEACALWCAMCGLVLGTAQCQLRCCCENAGHTDSSLLCDCCVQHYPMYMLTTPVHLPWSCSRLCVLHHTMHLRWPSSCSVLCSVHHDAWHCTVPAALQL
jgi:hypothetical protein